MRKIFLSFLGTTDYKPCSYYQDQLGMVENVRFVQEATIRLHCRDWGPEDRIIIFTTEDAEKKNWCDNGHIDGKTGDILERNGLKKCIQQIKINATVQNKIIPEGKSEAEIWEIFQIVYEKLKDGDEIVFDITHGFRSIPMLAIVVLNYAKVLKNIKLKGIYYGAFETLGSIAGADRNSPQERKVPIFDLTPFDQLLEWSTGIDRFIEGGNAELVNSLAQERIRPILKDTKGRDSTAVSIRKIGELLCRFTEILATCRGPEITGSAWRLKQELEKPKSMDLLQPFVPLFERIKDQMRPFRNDTVSDGLQAAKWCYSHNLIQQGYTILQETIIGYFVLKIGHDPEILQTRNIASQAVKISSGRLPEAEWASPAKDNVDLTSLFLEFFKKNEELIEMMKNFSNYRNDLNHAGHRENRMAANDFRKKLEAMINRFEGYLT